MMPRDIEITSLYNGPINLWVEDTLVRDYLVTLWNDPAIKYLIAGGKDGVRSAVQDAQRLGYVHVFGIVDGDDRPGDASNWLNPNKRFRTFVLPVHEIENYLLDAEALSGCALNNIGKTVQEIDRLLNTQAQQLCWWVACRAVVAEIKHCFQNRFLALPPASTRLNKSSALSHICDSTWFKQLPVESTRWKNAEVDRLLEEYHAYAQQSVADGSWVTKFPGKELFRHIRSQVFDRSKAKPQTRATSLELDSAVARAVADWRKQHGHVPQELTNCVRRSINGFDKRQAVPRRDGDSVVRHWLYLAQPDMQFAQLFFIDAAGGAGH